MRDGLYEPGHDGKAGGARTRRMERRASEDGKLAANKKKKIAKATTCAKVGTKSAKAVISKGQPSTRKASMHIPNARAEAGFESRARRSSINVEVDRRSELEAYTHR